MAACLSGPPTLEGLLFLPYRPSTMFGAPVSPFLFRFRIIRHRERTHWHKFNRLHVREPRMGDRSNRLRRVSLCLSVI